MSDNRFEYSYGKDRQDAKPATKHNLQKQDKAVAWSLCIGIISCLVFGLGLSCVLKWGKYVAGILCGLIGMAGMAIAPYCYAKLIDRQDKKENKQ